jgi:lipid A 4'-phosphatase
VIKKFKIELLILGLLLISTFISNSVDIGFYNFFNNSSKSFEDIYLKDFFEQITVLGDSKWYFVLSFFVIFFCYFIKKINLCHNHKNIIDICNNFTIFLSLSLIFSGLITQLLKHIVGRPRPAYASFDGVLEFSFINLNSEFHSFPSGHASTIFVVVLVTSFFLPKLKYFFISLGGIIAFSRVVVGAHFFTDVLGGITVSYLGVKLTKLFLDKRFPNITNKQTNLLFNNKFFLSLVVLLFLAIFLSVGSSFDIYLSSLFNFGNNQFLLQNYYYITIFVRKIILPAIIIYIFILPIFSFFLPIKKIYLKYEFKFRDILCLWVIGIFNLGIVINLFFKNIWGRARPGDILQLGGKENFTPWFQISDACVSNCSFVSGDASVGFSLIVFYLLIKRIIYFWSSLFFGFGIGLVRIMEGGHFVSDVIMAAMVLYLGYYFQMKYYFNKYD